MAGLNLQTGLSGSVVSGLYGDGSSSAQPTRTAVPEGPTTIAQAAYGGSGGSTARVGTHATLIGVIALGILICMWWGLPR